MRDDLAGQKESEVLDCRTHRSLDVIAGDAKSTSDDSRNR